MNDLVATLSWKDRAGYGLDETPRPQDRLSDRVGRGNRIAAAIRQFAKPRTRKQRSWSGPQLSPAGRVDGDVTLGRRGRRCHGGRLALAAFAAVCALATIAAVAVAAGSDGSEASGTPTESLGLHYWETGFGALAPRPDGGFVVERKDQLETFLADGAPDPAAPLRQLPEFSSWFPLASGKSLLLKGSKLTRLNADGTVDTGFGAGGTVEIEGAYSTQLASELPSGKILLAGAESGGTHTITTVLNVETVEADGSVDRSPGGSSALRLSLPAAGSVVGIAATGDGGTLLIGDYFLLELGADGRPNPAFGAGGLVLSRRLSLVGGHVLPDGSIAVVGTGPGSSGSDLLYARFTAAGKPDPGFGTGGVRLFDLGGEEEAHVASWAADGSVVVGGGAQPPGSCFEVADCDEVPILAAFDPAGNLDPTFGVDGVLRLDALIGRSDSLSSSGVGSLTRRPDGSLLAAGSAPPLETTAFLAAVSPQGALIPGFGEGGIVRERRSTPATQSIAGLTSLGDGKVLVAGSSDVGVEDAAVLIRYERDGSLDRSFGDGAGFVVAGRSGEVDGFAADGSGHLLTSLYGAPSTLVELRTADGSRESGFGADGSVALPRRIRVKAVAFTPGGGAAVAGTREVGGPAEPGFVLRYRSDGSPDRGFGEAGRVDLVTPGGEEVRTRALVADRRGRLLVAGFSHHRLALARLLRDGRPDPRFGSGGWVLARTAGQPRGIHFAPPGPVALCLDGSHYYLAGLLHVGTRTRLLVLRLGPDGRPDPGFGRGGRRTAWISKPAAPTAIVPARRGVLVALAEGRRPLISFEHGGKVRRLLVDRRGQSVSDVTAAASLGSLLLGWNVFSPESRSDVFYLGERRLGGR